MNERKEAIDIANETRLLFPVGSKVCQYGQPKKVGTVEGYKMGGSAIHGFDALSCLEIRWGTNKGTATLHRNFVTLVGSVEGQALRSTGA